MGLVWWSRELLKQSWLGDSTVNFGTHIIIIIITHADGMRVRSVFTAVCLFVFPDDISKIDAARIAQKILPVKRLYS